MSGSIDLQSTDNMHREGEDMMATTLARVRSDAKLEEIQTTRLTTEQISDGTVLADQEDLETLLTAWYRTEVPSQFFFEALAELSRQGLSRLAAT
jgi:hypothetical protein